MFEKIKGKKIKVSVAFVPAANTSVFTTKYFEGVIDDCYAFGGQMFLVFQDSGMINVNYIQTIEIL